MQENPKLQTRLEQANLTAPLLPFDASCALSARNFSPFRPLASEHRNINKEIRNLYMLHKLMEVDLSREQRHRWHALVRMTDCRSWLGCWYLLALSGSWTALHSSAGLHMHQ
jgi:hypothetical protein